MIEYLVVVEGTKAGAPVTQTVPAEQAEAKPLAITVGAQQQSNASGLHIPETDGPLVGFSLQTIEASQQIKRKFTFNRTEVERKHINPNGPLSRDEIGPDFDADEQVTRVALGQGPFKLLTIKAQAGFDFDAHHVLSAVVQIEYGRNATGTGPLHAPDIRLTKDQPSGQVQFFADEDGRQDYSYHVTFTYDPDRVVGSAGRELRSKRFEGVLARSLTVDLDLHSPLLPVEVVPGRLRFDDQLVEQVQVRVAPSREGEGRNLILDRNSAREKVYVLPEDPAAPGYFLRQETFFRNDSSVIEREGVTDTQIVVNEPTDAIFRMTPQLVDPYNLVKEAVVDTTYTHADGERETATLRLKPDAPRDVFSVVLRDGDVREWDAATRFVMTSGDARTAPLQHFTVTEPFVSLTDAGLRVVEVELLEDPSIFTLDGLLGIKVLLGTDLTNPALPTSTVMLRGTRTSAATVVPGARRDAAVAVAIEALRRGQPPARTTTSLSPSETTLYVQL
ncbi:MAG TPA: hypothetical protein VN213_16910 [Solirubrobacteraceae bacterium]|nr:hypothetical protein [Solirubrobacteraceae bacterium]